MDTYFAVSAPGLEPFTAQELASLAFQPAGPGFQPSEGGILFKGELKDLYRANLQLRTTSRILARLGSFFRATTFPELQKRAAHLPWERCLRPAQPVALHVTCRHSKLYHSDAVARSVLAGLEERLGKASPLVRSDEEADGHPPQLIVVRLADDRCTVSVDSSGELLHKRGYRQAVAKAPVRETLAAALILASGWDSSAVLLDPFCGSGTIPIEAALIKFGIPPGISRRFAFMDWPGYDEAAFAAQRLALSSQAADLAARPPTPMILASDRDAGAIEMARANAERAGVAEHIEFKCQAVSAIAPPAGPGWLVTNPPYGVRVSEGHDLRNLYAQLGNVLRRKCPGWSVTVLCNDPSLLGQMQMDLDSSLGFVNGGIGVRVGRGKVIA